MFDLTDVTHFWAQTDKVNGYFNISNKHPFFSKITKCYGKPTFLTESEYNIILPNEVKKINKYALVSMAHTEISKYTRDNKNGFTTTSLSRLNSIGQKCQEFYEMLHSKLLQTIKK